MYTTIAGALLLTASGILYAIERTTEQISWAMQVAAVRGSEHGGTLLEQPGPADIWANPFVVWLAAVGGVLLIVGVKAELRLSAKRLRNTQDN